MWIEHLLHLKIDVNRKKNILKIKKTNKTIFIFCTNNQEIYNSFRKKILIIHRFFHILIDIADVKYAFSFVNFFNPPYYCIY